MILSQQQGKTAKKYNLPTKVVIQNPETLDFQHNREFYRVPAQFDCIYTIDTDEGVESFNAETYDISTGGVSIITNVNIIPTRETSIVIFMPDRELKAYLKIVRCDVFEGKYKLSFMFFFINKEYIKSGMANSKRIGAETMSPTALTTMSNRRLMASCSGAWVFAVMEMAGQPPSMVTDFSVPA